MAFREPLLLAGLLLVPLALLAYVAAQRRRRRFAVRYTNLDLLAAVAGRDPLRHLPAALALLALAALLVAMARPERTVADERKQATVVMVTDRSGSMRATDVKPTRLDAAKAAARTLVAKLPGDYKLGLVTFGSSADQLVAPTDDKKAVLRGIASIHVHGATAMGDGLSLGLTAAGQRVPRAVRPPAAIVLLSDGSSDRGQDPIAVAAQARKAGIRVYTVALGAPNPTTLQDIARTTGGRFYDVASAGRLKEIYAQLGTRFAKLQERQELTAAFAGGALVLLLIGAATGLVRAGRLP